MPRMQRALSYAAQIERGIGFETFDASDDALLVTEAALPAPGPRIVYANAALERLCGYASAELLGQSPRLLQGFDTDRDELARFRHALETRGFFQGEILNYDKRRQEYVLCWTVVPIHDAAGAICNWLSLQVDELRRMANKRARQVAFPA